jgi:hypothetical protein
MSERESTRVRWILIGWIFVLSAVGYLDRVNIGIASGSIMRDFHFSKIQFGLIQSFFVGAGRAFGGPSGCARSSGAGGNLVGRIYVVYHAGAGG